MDVEAAIALATTAAATAASGAATEAGRAAWESLVGLARRLTGRAGPQPPESAQSAQSAGSAESAADLVARIAARARADREFAAALCQWADTHRAALTVDQSTVHNEISGTATVQGPVIQARDIHGGISFGA